MLLDPQVNGPDRDTRLGFCNNSALKDPPNDGLNIQIEPSGRMGCGRKQVPLNVRRSSPGNHGGTL